MKDITYNQLPLVVKNRFIEDDVLDSIFIENKNSIILWVIDHKIEKQKEL